MLLKQLWIELFALEATAILAVTHVNKEFIMMDMEQLQTWVPDVSVGFTVEMLLVVGL